MKSNKKLIILILLLSTMPVCFGKKQYTALKKADMISAMKKVADWQIRNFKYATDGNLHDFGANAWTNAVFYIGMTEWAKIAEDSSCYHWLTNIGATNEWKIAANFIKYPKLDKYHADELCIGQFYLNMFDRYKDDKMLQSTKIRAEWILNNPPDSTMNISNKQSWTWCDALFMAPPVYAHLAKIEGNDEYLQFMDKEFKRTYKALYDSENKLFFRDSNYFDKREANGNKVFWGRGNGWVAAGLANLLKQLPENSPYRPFYENLFKEFVPRLVELQSNDGFWHASLLDSRSYPAPETSATALIAYALAYGINQGLLDSKTCMPVLEKSWKSLFSAINKDGKLGWVQPVGADPKKVTEDMTAPYGTGAFLLAAAEIYFCISNNV